MISQRVLTALAFDEAEAKREAVRKMRSAAKSAGYFDKAPPFSRTQLVKGMREENARLSPIHQALANVVEAAEIAVCVDDATFHPELDDALIELERALKECGV